MLTLEEQERRAYIENRPEHAALVAAHDAQCDAIDELEHEVRAQKDEVHRLEAVVEALEDELSATEIA